MGFDLGKELQGVRDSVSDGLSSVGESLTGSAGQIIDSAGDFGRAIGRGDFSSAGQDLLSIGAEATNIVTGGTLNIAFDAFKRMVQPDIPPVDYEDRKNQINSASAPRRMIYGKVRVGGVARYAESSGTNDKFIHLIHIFAAHSCAEVEKIYFNDELAFIGTTAQGKFVGKATAIIETGKQTTANAAIVADTPANWTNNHKLLGQTYVYFKLEYDTDAYRSVPNITAVIRGKDDIVDIRTGSAGWTDNQALCILDYIQSDYGYRAKDSEVNLPSFSEGADIADDLVSSGVGSNEKRYTVNGTISIIDQPSAPLENMLIAGMSGLQYVQGQFVFVPGAYKAPTSQASVGTSDYTFDSTDQFSFDSTITPTFDHGYFKNFKFTDDDLIGGIAYTPSGDTDSRVNAIRGTYIDPNQNYEAVDFVQLRVPSYEIQDKEILFADTKFQFVDSGTKARRLSKLFLERSRYGVRISLRLKVRVLEFGVGDRIEFESESEGLDNKIYRIDDMTPSLNGVEVSLSEDAPIVWAWEEGDALVVTPPPVLNLPNPNIVATPTGLTAAESVYTGNDQSSIKSRVTISWDDDDVIQRWDVQGSFNLGAFYDLTSFVSTNSLILDDAQIGDWDFRVRAVNGIGVKSDYITFSFTTNGKADVPAEVTGFTGTRRPNGVDINWNELPDKDTAYYEVRNGASWAAGTPIRQTNSNGFLWEPDIQTVSTLWVKSFDKSGGESATAASLVVGTGATAITSATGPIQNAKTSFIDDTPGYYLGAGEFYVGESGNKLKFNSANGLEIDTSELTIFNGSVDFSGTMSTSNNRFKVNASTDVNGSVLNIDTLSGSTSGITTLARAGIGISANSLTGRSVVAASAITNDYSAQFSSTGASNLGVLFQTSGSSSPQAASFFGVQSGIRVSTSSSGAAGEAAIVATAPNGAAHIQMLTEHTVFPTAGDGAMILGKNAGGDNNVYIRSRGQWHQLSWGGSANDGDTVF